MPPQLLPQHRVSLYSPGCPRIHSIDQTGLELTEIYLPALASQVLGLKACATTAQLFVTRILTPYYFKKQKYKSKHSSFVY